MVTLPLLIALLTLIDVTRSFEYFIDLKRCELEDGRPEMACYVRDSCVVALTPGDPNTFVRYHKAKLINGTCDVIVQIKAFTESRLHMLFQVNVTGNDSPLDELDTATGITMSQVAKLITCSSNGVTGTYVFGGTHGTRQIISNNLIFCSAIFKNPTDKPVSNAFRDDEYEIYPTLTIPFKNGETQVIKFPAEGESLWTFPRISCDDTKIASSSLEEKDGTDEYLLSPIDSSARFPSCSEGYTFRVEYGAKKIMTSSLYCNVLESEWTFKDGDNYVLVPRRLPFYAHCAIKINEICALSPIIFKNCRGCSKPNNTYIDTFECPRNKWRMIDGSVMETEVKCKRQGNERTSTWQMDNGIEITEGACSEEFDCATFNKFDFTVPYKDNVNVYKSVDQFEDGNRLNCSEGFNLTVSSDGATEIIEKNLVCNTENGYFHPEEKRDKQIKNTSSVHCAKKHGEVIEEDKPKDSQSGAMSETTIASIGGSIVGLLFIGGVVAAIILSRRSKRIQEEKALEENKRNTLSTCREIDPNLEFIIVEGLKWNLQEVTGLERTLRDRMRIIMKRIEPLAYDEDGQQKAKDNDLIPRPGEFDHWTNSEFMEYIGSKFHRFTSEHRIQAIRALTAFISFSKVEDWHGKKKINEFGTIDQFFDLLKMSHVHKIKDFEVWDHLFRLSVRFHDTCPDKGLLNAATLLRYVWKEIAKTMLDDLGARAFANETYQMTGIRQIALRIMLWLKDHNWTRFIAEEAKKHPRAIANEIRPVVLQYAVRECGREHELTNEFFDEVKLMEWEGTDGVRHGLYRHHLIYALCSSKDRPDKEGKTKNYPTRNEIISAIYKNYKTLEKCYSAKDIYYAFKGATEDTDGAVWALEMYIKNERRCTEDDYDGWSDWICKNSGESRSELLTARFKQGLVATMQLVGESCTSVGLFKDLKDAWRGCIEYAVPKGSNVFNEEYLEERARNVQTICLQDDFSKMMFKAISNTFGV